MTIKQLAEKIPAKFRKEILEMNLIRSAVAVSYDPSMQYLAVVYKEYINASEDADCAKCLSRMLDHWKSMQPYLVDLEKQQSLLDSI